MGIQTMKILELEYRGPLALGGVETHVFEISKQFKSKGYDVEIWSTDLLDFKGERDKRLERIVAGIRVIKFRSFKIPKFPLFMYPSIYPKMFFEFLKIKKNDMILHSHSFPSFHSYIALLFHRKFRKVTITPHFDVNDLKNFTSGFVGKLAFRILKHFVNKKKNLYLSAITRKEKEFYVNDLGFKVHKVLVVPNGVNIEDFDSISNEEVYQIKKQYKLENTFNVLYAGRVAKIKGIDVLLKAMSKLDNSNMVLTIAGPDFGALSELQELSQCLDLADRVTFTGALERRKFCALIKSCDVCVLPSYGGEAFGIVLTEAMACNKPVIGSKTGGISEIVKLGENGFLFDVGSIKQLSEKINLLYQDRTLCRKLGDKGREIVEKYYTWENIADTYLKLWGMEK